MKPWTAKVNGEEVKAGDTKTAYSLGGGKLSKFVCYIPKQRRN